MSNSNVHVEASGKDTYEPVVCCQYDPLESNDERCKYLVVFAPMFDKVAAAFSRPGGDSGQEGAGNLVDFRGWGGGGHRTPPWPLEAGWPATRRRKKRSDVM